MTSLVKLTVPALERIRYALQTSDNLIRHYGSNATEKGLPHPQQLALNNNEKALEALTQWDAAMGAELNVGWCPVCDAPRRSLPAPAEGTCTHCYNHLLTLRNPFADQELIAALQAQLATRDAEANS